MMKTIASDDCEAIVRRMWAHLDGALSDAERDRVIRHLLECDACASHFRFAQEFLDAIHQARPDERDFAPLRERVGAALAAEGYVAS